MPCTRLALVLCFGLFAPLAASADSLHLKNGRVVEGDIVQETNAAYCVRVAYGHSHFTLNYPKTDVEFVKRTALTEAKVEGRLFTLDRCLFTAGRQNWMPELKAIPATVIDKGVLRHVPYLSFKAGDYEINVYGDPNHPACVEIGVQNRLLESDAAKKNCVAYAEGILTAAEDRALLRTMNLRKDLKERGELKFEITPPTDEDAYGGWWVSVYDEKLLDKSRASDKELAEITIPKSQILEAAPIKSQAEAHAQPPSWTASDLRFARPVASAVAKPGTQPIKTPAVVPLPPVNTTGTVYVQGYYRKDGTYVHPHTRSAPSSKK